MAGGAEEDDAHGEAATALYTYEAVAEGQLSVVVGDALRVLNHDNSAEWWYCARVRAASRAPGDLAPRSARSHGDGQLAAAAAAVVVAARRRCSRRRSCSNTYKVVGSRHM